MGVRISWLMLARNSLLERLAASASSFAFCSSTWFSSSSVMSSRLTSTPPALPSPPVTGEQLALNVWRFPAASERCSFTSRCRVFSASARTQGKSASCIGAPSAPVQPSVRICCATRSSGDFPVSDANAWLARTMSYFLSITSRPSARVSSAARTRAGTARDGSRWRSMRPR